MADGIEFKTWEEVEKGRVAQRNIEAANRILEAAGITEENPNYKRYYNATLLNVHNAGRFAVKDTNTGEIMTYNEHVENMFIETLKNPEMSIEQYEQATTAFRDSFAKDQMDIQGEMSNVDRDNFSYQRATDAINTAIKDGMDMRQAADVKFPQEFYDENGGLRRLVVEIPEEFKSGADYVQEAAAEYGLRFEEVDGKKYFIDAKGNKVGPSKFFSGKSDLLQNRLLDKIGADAELLDMADKELFDVIKSGDYQAFNALRAQRKGKGNPQLMNALSDEHIFHDVGKILNSADNMDKSVFVDEVKKLADTYKAKAQKVQTDASGTSWGKSIDRVMFSATPYDVATQSTFRNWQSCMHANGIGWNYVDDAIGVGSIVAYGYNSKNPQQMISRYLIHPYYDESGNVAYRVNDHVYGNSHSGLRKTVESVTEHFNEGKKGVYRYPSKLYDDNKYNQFVAFLSRDAEGRIILDELAKDGEVEINKSLQSTINANDKLMVSDDVEVLIKRFSIPEGVDLSSVKNLTLEGYINIGKDVKLPDNIKFDNTRISGYIPDGTDLSSTEKLRFQDYVEIGKNVKLPDNICFVGHIADGTDLSSVKNLTLEGSIKTGKNVKLPDNVRIVDSLADGTDLSSVKNLTLEGYINIGKDVKLPDNIKFSGKVDLSGHIPDGVDLSSAKDLTLGYGIKIGKNVKLPDNICFVGHIADGTDLSSAKNLTISSGYIDIGKDVKLPDNVYISNGRVLGDLSSAKNLTLDGDIKIYENVKLPDNVRIVGNIADGTDLSSVKNLILDEDVKIGKNVKLPDNVQRTTAAVNTEGAIVTEKTPAAVNAERTTVTEKTPAAVNAEVTTPSGSSGTLNRINNSFDNALDNIGTKLNDNKLGRAATKMEKAGMIPAAAAVTGGILAYEEYKLTGDYWAAAGTFGKTMKTPVIQATAMVVGTQATMWGAEKATSYYVYKTVEKEATEEVAKRVSEMAGKSVAGTIGKKVPLISVGFGIYYGIERFNEGDYLGAVGEVASGVCGVFPGIGTAASVAIDASLAGRDIYNELHAAETQAQIDAMFTSPGISEAEAAELQPQIDAAAAQDINKEADTPQDSTKVQAKIDAENAQKYGEQQQQRVLRLTKQSTASRMKNNTVAAQDICKELDARSDNTRVQAKTEAEIAQEYGAPKQQRVLRLPYASNGFQNKNQRQ